ncbi:Hsp70 family protein [Corynebacterium breve]|uniref:Hsp70 family protein n=1 Tax=Corynebacterium breve TaxID=3049799 RepID=A0ABY8VFD4_9CORY|nr:Hsp70 family protein [Corynebacterium breve]WIM68052.1 Hsp70 family protein [Corynebacterium breve]
MRGEVETLALSHRSNLMPTAVFVDKSSGAPQFVAGDNALVNGRREPGNLVMSPKRFIDHDVIKVGGDDISAVEINAAVFSSVLERAKSQHSGTMPATVTLTHPEAWSPHAVGTLIDSICATGIARDQVLLISEPRAASIHYAAQQKIEAGDHVAVFDFGGGTLDIAVLQAKADGNFDVVSTKGDNSLGGRTVDNLLFRWLIDQIGKEDADLSDYLHNAPISVMHSVTSNIREAKEMLSDTSSATVNVSTPEGEHDVLLTRDEFNAIIAPAVDRAVELAQSALEQAGANSATPIYMTGGSSRIPYVQNRLFELGSVMTLDDPKTVVSRGALRASLLGFTHHVDGSPTQALQNASPTATEPHNPFGSPPPTIASPAVQHEASATSSMASFSRPAPASGKDTKPKAKKGKGPLIASATVAAVIVFGAVGFYAVKGGGGDAPQPVSADLTAIDSSLVEDLIEVDPVILDTMPAAYFENTSYYSEPKMQTTSLEVLDGFPVPVSTGSSKENDSKHIGKSSKYLATGEDAKTGFEWMRDGNPATYDFKELQAPKKNRPGVYHWVGQQGTQSQTAMVVYYPDAQVLAFNTAMEQSADDIQKYAEEVGFM